MSGSIVEVKNAVLHDYEGQQLEVNGGVWLSPEAYLSAEGELERLRQRQAAEERSFLVPIVIGATLLGVAAGFWLGRTRDDES